MRINSLEISAFGPFKDLNTIDFSLINPKQIFLVSGPTGSGKTTIFDAISFALYGKASGSTRSDMENVRSDFALDETDTFVAMEFQIKNKDYYIKRSPKQERKKRNSEDTTIRPHQVEFYEKGNPNQVYTKVNDVNEEIIKLLGISYEQFRQIVMLPQGEFQKLLNAKSEERTDIFRKIFKTYFYDNVQQELKNKSDSLKKEVENLETSLRVYYDNIITRENKKLEESIQEINKEPLHILKLLLEDNRNKKQELDQKRLVYEDIVKEVKQREENLRNVKLVNGYIERYNHTSTLLEKEKTKEKEIEGYRHSIIKIRYAKELEAYEKNKNDQAKQVSNNIDNINDLQNIIAVKQKEFEEAKTQFDTLTSIKESIFILETKKDINKTLLENLSKQRDLKADILHSNLIIENCKTLIEETEAENNKLKMNGKQIEENLEKATIFLKENQHKQVDLLQFQQRKKDYLELERKINQYLSKKKQYLIDSYSFEEYTVSFSSLEEAFRGHTSDYYKSQAGILATTLKTGQECPVCGSLSHPKKAIDSVLLTSEKYKEIELHYNKNRDMYNSKKMHLENAFKELNELEVSVKEVCKELNILYDEKIMDTIHQLVLEIETHIKLTTALITKVNETTILIESLGKRKHGIEQNLNSNTIKTQSQLDRINQHNGILTSIGTQLEKIEALIPSNHLSIDELNIIQTNIDKERLELEQRINLITNTYNETKRIVSNHESSAKTAKENLVINQKRLKTAQDTYTSKLFESFDTEIEYHEYLKQIKLLAGQELEVKNFDDNILRFNQTIHDLTTLIKDKEFTDVSPLEVNLNQITIKLEEMQKEINEKGMALRNNENYYTKIKATFSTSEDMYKAFNDVNEIALLARGMKGNKISFERYVLAHYFNQILNEANMKLAVMTGERYSLFRKNEKTKGSQQQGLDLVVYDAHTSKTRDVSTLSGGESFKAALALALGLAEIIQQNSGGVNLETMFIDEGFGTLDSDSLDMAIEVLMNINQAGRVLGIISHVQELKTRIETKIELSITNEGSSINLQNI